MQVCLRDTRSVLSPRRTIDTEQSSTRRGRRVERGFFFGTNSITFKLLLRFFLRDCFFEKLDSILRGGDGLRQ